MTAADIIAIATIATRMKIFILFLGDFSDADRADKRRGAVK
jgi:hypothetical protein